MNIPCPNVLPCDCTASPFANLSQEAPDLPFFFSTAFGRGIVPLGAAAFQMSCVAVCANAPTQAQADLCAAEQAYLCSNNYGFPNPALPFAPPAPPPQSLIDGIPFAPFRNNAQTGFATCPDGNISEFVVPAGSFAGNSQQAVDESALSYANRQARLGQICITFNLTQCCVGQPVTIIATATGARLATGMNTNNWELTTLPPGLEANEGNIIGDQLFITGTPTMAGSYTIFVTLTDPVGDTITVPYDLFIGGITDPTLPTGTTGQSYAALLTVAGFQSAATFTLFSGVLPPGLFLAANGSIFGTPTAPGTYIFDVEVSG